MDKSRKHAGDSQEARILKALEPKPSKRGERKARQRQQRQFEESLRSHLREIQES